MGTVYQSLREVVQDTFQRGKGNSSPAVRVKTGSALTLTDEVKDLENLILDKIDRITARIKENDEWVAGETKHAEDLIDSLRAKIADLETQLSETQETNRTLELAHRGSQERLNAKIDILENDLRAKEQVLESRAGEITGLNSKIDDQVKQITELNASLHAAKAETATHIERGKDLSATLLAKIAASESQLKDAHDLVKTKEAALKGLEESFNARILDLEHQLNVKHDLLAGRDTEITTLKSQLKTLTNGLEQMAFLFRKAEALAAMEGQSSPTNELNVPAAAGEPQPVTSEQPNPPAIVSDGGADIVSDYIFGDMIRELAELTNVIGIVASVIVREHATALGESMERFPKTRLPELIESLAGEIVDQNRKAKFRERLNRV